MKAHLLLPIISVLFLFSCPREEEFEPTVPTSDCPLSNSEFRIVKPLNDGQAYPFASANPTEADPDLDPLINYLGNTPFVGLGEGTHGTAEFYQMKDKIFRRLVQEHDFNAMIFELPWGQALSVNDFVRDGIGSASTSVAQTGYWTYNTQEVQDLVQWMHDYNQGQVEADKIYFVGCDVQGDHFRRELEIIQTYLAQYAPEVEEDIMAHYAQLPTHDLLDYVNASSDLHNTNSAGAQAAYAQIEQERDNWTALSGEFAYELALMAAHVIERREFTYRTQSYGASRDFLMAFYSEWWQRILGADAKVAIWAHNVHVMDADYFNGNFMGTYLRSRQNTNYKNVGFSFGKGSANAVLVDENFQTLQGVQSQSIPQVECETVNALLTGVDGDQHYLIFEELSGETADYFEAQQQVLQFGAVFNYDHVQRYISTYRLSSLFDVLIHFDETQASELR
ncbi:MAG: erythromycin esterase family protein [Bacteroidota bacterium]